MKKLIKWLRIYPRYCWTRYDRLVRNGAVFTLIFFLIVLALSFSPACENPASSEKACVTKWGYFLRAAPNEVGDTLAGMAGALAFLWIIVTVMLQSKELAAQRQELQLTRKEFEQQREATQDMANAVSLQTNLLIEESRHRAGQSAKLEFDGLLELIIKNFSIASKRIDWWTIKGLSTRHSIATGKTTTEETTAPIYSALSFSRPTLGENIQQFVEELNSLHRILVLHEREVIGRSKSKSEFEKLSSGLQSAMSLVPQMNPVDRLWVKERGIEDASEKLREVIRSDVWVEES